jgi:Chaperone of endosialidase
MRLLAVSMASWACLCTASMALGQTTEFTYQGQLRDASLPANGLFDLELRLFDVPSGSSPLATLQRTNVTVNAGLFTVTLDFGTQFTGAARYLEIAVRPAGGGAYSTLAPRQALTSAPYATRSALAGTADTAESALTAHTADALGAACVTCVVDAQIAAVAGVKISGQVPVLALPPGSEHYVQNGTLQQAASSFNVSGTGRVGGAFSADSVNAVSQYRIGDAQVLAVPGSQNAFLGLNAGSVNTTGFGNSFLGHFAGNANVIGSNNTFVGTDAGRTNTANGNTFVGRSAGYATTTGAQNVFIGLDSGRFNTTGIANVALGEVAGYNNTTGVGNVFLGRLSGFSNTVESLNIFLGFQANGAAGITNATAIGANASVTTSNTMVLGTLGLAVRVPGTLAVTGNASGNAIDSATFFSIGGAPVLSLLGPSSVFVGPQAGNAASTGTANTFVGQLAGSVNSSGTANSFFGQRAGLSNALGSGNAFFGNDSGANSVGQNDAFFGGSAGLSNSTGSNNTALGSGADVASGSLTFATAIGSGAVVAQSNTIQLGRAADRVRAAGGLTVASDLVVGTVISTSLSTGGSVAVCRNGSGLLSTCSSSLRYKADVRPLAAGLDVVRRLQPITFSWRDTGLRDLGFAAEAVAAVEPLLATYGENGEVEGVKYGQLTAILVNALHEQQEQIALLQTRVASQRLELTALRRLVCRANPDDELCR